MSLLCAYTWSIKYEHFIIDIHWQLICILHYIIIIIILLLSYQFITYNKLVKLRLKILFSDFLFRIKNIKTY